MTEQDRWFSPSKNGRKDDLHAYVESIREAVESRAQLTEAGVIEMRSRVVGGQTLRFSRDRIK